ncbi:MULTISPECIES: helix-turn-helix domain-containing protein [Citricoccus]|uniref:helix-turn-helix domain-containing protein n=1 Tax=Citricoccus TaxID=169133 RepID=UPI000255F6C7|nr:helix-turn-helix transcriptional regulator [Citricoccus sp. CH26A]
MSTQEQRRLAGAYIRQQRKLADMSMRQVSAMVGISNPYLSQIERGLRAPSEAVAAGIATALGVNVHDLYGPGEGGGTVSGLEAAIQAASELTAAQRASLTEIYRSFVRANEGDAGRDAGPGGDDPAGAASPD